MMKTNLLVCFYFWVGICSATLAQQEVCLRQGTRFIGKVQVDGSNIIVAIDEESKITVPLSDVASIAPVGTPISGDSANHLLLIALESKLHSGSSEGMVGLLGEAYRLSPEDGRIAYWYADALLQAGHGSSANQIFLANREAIEKKYPGYSDKLLERINARLALSQLPNAMVVAIEEISKNLKVDPDDNENVKYYCRFRIVDNHGKPLEKNEFSITAQASQENLESFGNGYFLYSFSRYRSHSMPATRLKTAKLGILPKEYELRVSRSSIEDNGEFVAQKLEEKDRQQVSFNVLDEHRQPLAEATVSLWDSWSSPNRERIIEIKPDERGILETRLFPSTYSFSVTSPNYLPSMGTLELVADRESKNAQEVQLFRLLAATIKLSWKNPNHGADIPPNQSKLEIRNGQLKGMEQASLFGTPIVRLSQVRDQIVVSFQPTNHNHYFGESWVRKLPMEIDSLNEDILTLAQERYERLKLEEVDSTKSKGITLTSGEPPFPVVSVIDPRSFREPPVASVRVQTGEIYFGKTILPNARNGLPEVLNFKLLVEYAGLQKD